MFCTKTLNSKPLQIMKKGNGIHLGEVLTNFIDVWIFENNNFFELNETNVDRTH